MSKTTVVSFDIGNTLIDLKAGKGFCTYFCEQVGMDLSKIHKLVNKYFLCTELPMNIAVKTVCELMGNDSYHRIVDNYIPNPKITVFDDVIPVLRILRNSNIEIIAFSNCTPWEATGLNECGLAEYINKVYYSFNIGMTKPEIKAFDYVRADINKQADEILHVGDTFDADVLGALNANWNACWLNRKAKPMPSEYDRKIQVISSLWGLIDILKL